jgi:hypothetical protein
MATGNQVLRAYSKAVKRIEDDRSMSASRVSAGFIFSPKQKKGCKIGYQVFVKVCRYSDKLLVREPDSGGLDCESKTMRQWERWNEIIEPLFAVTDKKGNPCQSKETRDILTPICGGNAINRKDNHEGISDHRDY